MTKQNTGIQTEYEATFVDIDVEHIREKLKALGGVLKRPQFMQKRTVCSFPKGHEIQGGFLRVRDEGDKITMSIKIMEGSGTIEGQKEIELMVNSYTDATQFLQTIGAEPRSEQESKRELWQLNDTEIMIDWWPFLEPFIEIEGPSEDAVKNVANTLDCNWEDAIFDSVDAIYSNIYNISKDRVNNHTPKILFNTENPFTE